MWEILMISAELSESDNSMSVCSSPGKWSHKLEGGHLYWSGHFCRCDHFCSYLWRQYFFYMTTIYDNEDFLIMRFNECKFNWKIFGSIVFWCTKNSEKRLIKFSCSLSRHWERLISIFVSLKRWRRETIFWNFKSRLKLHIQACILFSIPHDEAKHVDVCKLSVIWVDDPKSKKFGGKYEDK